MMRAGKDYIAKDQPEGEDARSRYLQELLRTVNGPASAETASEPAAQAVAPIKLPNKDKPKLTLR